MSCTISECRKPMLFDLEADIGERNDLSEVHPEILQDLQGKFMEWQASVMKSRSEESKCRGAKNLAVPEQIAEEFMRTKGQDKKDRM